MSRRVMVRRLAAGVTSVVLGRLVLLLYTAVVVASCLAAVSNEEPVLRRRFGDRYRRYCRTNHSWIPRATRWSDPDSSDPSNSLRSRAREPSEDP
jgi:hypothetical protein